ncbi:MAG TPA: hypothetical protein VLC07_09215 [Solirubrobacterales bacterium]|nr:hypothetical protein [Solirubrobacterales bacterium]
MLTLVQEVWDERVVSDGLVGLTAELMAEWHGFLREGDRTKGQPRNGKVLRRADKACKRLRRNLDPAFDPEVELHRITLAIARFVIDANEIKPFESSWASIETLCVHAACKFAGCAPPAEVGGDEWDRLVLRETETLSKAERAAALAQILFERIRESMDDMEGEA